MTTQVYCDWVPFSAPMIWGSATDTIVPLIMATNRTSSNPLRAFSTCRCVIGSAGAVMGALTRDLRFGSRGDDRILYFPLRKFAHCASIPGG
ncbi:hypothetical protein GCM10023096_55240 [Nonomuraea ferruginea]